MPRGHIGNRIYTKDEKLKALDILHHCGKNFEEAARQAGVNDKSLMRWAYSDWGKLRLAEFAIRDNSAAVNTGLQAIVDTKLDHIKHQFAFFTEMEEMMSECINRYRDLIPASTKLSDVNDAFKVISDAYIKALSMINKEPGEEKKDDVENYIVNIIDKQLVARPESIQELLGGKR